MLTRQSILKAATAAPHAELEQEFSILANDLTLAKYRQMISRMYGYYADIEPEVFDLLDGHPVCDRLAERRKLHLLRDDLLALGVADNLIEVLPRCDCREPLRDLSEALGALYVLEGSTLGGQMISRHITKTLEISRGTGLSFFSSYGDEVGRMWRLFCDCLEQTRDNTDEAAMIHGAKATFHSMREWLNASEVVRS